MLVLFNESCFSVALAATFECSVGVILFGYEQSFDRVLGVAVGPCTPTFPVLSLVNREKHFSMSGELAPLDRIRPLIDSSVP